MKTGLCTFAACLMMIGGGAISPASALDYEEYSSIRLRSLDKITARTLTFDAQVGSTIKFGDIYIKIQSCRKPPPVEKTEAASFLQIWQIDKATEESRWIFSGWMFASSPALSGMNHPVYDVWVIDCLGKDPEAEPPPVETKQDEALPDEGEVPAGSVAEPTVTPEEQKDTAPLEDVPTTEAPQAESTPVQQDTPVAPVMEDIEKENPAPEDQGQDENIEGIY